MAKQRRKLKRKTKSKPAGNPLDPVVMNPEVVPTKKMGRPSKFTETLSQRMIELVEAGATDVEIAKAIGVSEKTINIWKESKIDFLQSLKRGKDIADQLVEASLFQRALGYSHPAVRHFVDKQKVWDEELQQDVYKTVIIEQVYIEHYPPSEVACIFWLKNRQPDRWREKPLGADGEGDEAKQPKEIVVEFQDETPTKDAK